jgi:hypothetical protein
VIGEPTFFRRAFGETYEQFEEILRRPQHFIFNREWYEQLGGRAEFDEYQATAGRLNPHQRAELLALLSSVDPSKFSELSEGTLDPSVRSALRFYIPLPKHEEVEIWRRRRQPPDDCDMASDERVEDAGLDDSDDPDILKLASAA